MTSGYIGITFGYIWVLIKLIRFRLKATIVGLCLGTILLIIANIYALYYVYYLIHHVNAVIGENDYKNFLLEGYKEEWPKPTPNST